MSRLAENYRGVLERIADAATRSGRKPGDVRLLGVTKRVPVPRILEAVSLGLRDFGENRVQEAEGKIPLVREPGVRWHFIGHLQSNKARRALDLFASIRTVDSLSLARRLNGMLHGPYAVFIEVRSGDEPTKSGVNELELEELVQFVRGTQYLRLEGFMAVPPYFENPEKVRPYFSRLRELAAEHGVPGLSIGMSHDFEIAIEEGATEVRIGTALFGERR